MNRKKLIICLVIVLSIISATSLYAREIRLKKILYRLTKPELTTLQKSALLEEYKGKSVTGFGRVKDVFANPQGEDRATVQLKRRFKGNDYFILLETDKEDVKRLKRNRKVRFVGIFEGMRFATLRFSNVKIKKSRGLF